MTFMGPERVLWCETLHYVYRLTRTTWAAKRFYEEWLRSIGGSIRT